MKFCCLLGNPSLHSLSPKLHNACYQALGIDWQYSAFEPDDIYSGLDAIRYLKFRGASITIPFKETACNTEYLEELSPGAKSTGAVSAVVNQDGYLKGYNTDLDGLFRAFESKKVELSGKKALVYGAGGVSRSVALTLFEHGADVYLYTRSEWRKKSLQHFFPWLKFSAAGDFDFDVFANATSLGLAEDDYSPFPDECFKPSSTFIELPYSINHKTATEKLAASASCKIVSGRDILIGLAKEQFRLFTELEAPDGVMESLI